MRIFPRLILVALILVLAVPPNARAVSADDLVKINKAIADGHIAPRYAAFAEAAGDLQRTAETVCGDRTAAGFTALRTEFQAVADKWAAIQHIRFGPIEDEDRYLRVQFWPDKKNIVSRHLAQLLSEQDNKVLEPANFADTSVAVQGLPALERLLYDEGAEAAFVGGTAEAAYRCRVVVRIASNLASIGDAVTAAWQPDGDFYKLFTEPGADDPVYLTPAEATQDLHGALLSGMETVRDLKLARPLGESLKRARPHTAEFWRSGRSVRGMILDLEALIALYAGTDEHHDGFRDEVLEQNGGDEVDATIFQGLTLAVNILKDVNPDIEVAVTDPDERRRLQLVLSQLDFLKKALRTDLAGILGLGVGFNATDGD